MTTLLPLKLNNVSYQLAQKKLLRQINISFEAKNLSVILGANGAGKTLLLKLCCGLIQPSSGQLQWAKTLSTRRGELPPYTLVFQKPVLLQRSVLANLCFALQSLPKDQVLPRALAALEWAGIEHLSSRNATTLSTGQQQIVAIARAWATAPEVLFLDEPTANLDPDATERMETLIANLHHDGTKIIMSTHNLGQAQRLADTITFLDHGQVCEQQSAKAFFTAPKSPIAQRFLSVQGFKP